MSALARIALWALVLWLGASAALLVLLAAVHVAEERAERREERAEIERLEELWRVPWTSGRAR